jgi:hypothetical protein
MQWAQGQTEAAIASLTRAVEITPGWGAAQTALGNALLAGGDQEGAAMHYRLAQIATGTLREGVAYDFASRLAEAEIESPSPEHVRKGAFIIGGEQRAVLFEHPDSRVGYSVEVSEDMLLSFGVATDPESWRMPGDGVCFAVYVRTDQSEKKAFELYLDPKNEILDRRWRSHVLDLNAYAGQQVTLIFETGGGPNGDSRYDWAGWGEPKLLVLKDDRSAASDALGTAGRMVKKDLYAQISARGVNRHDVDECSVVADPAAEGG